MCLSALSLNRDESWLAQHCVIKYFNCPGLSESDHDRSGDSYSLSVISYRRRGAARRCVGICLFVCRPLSQVLLPPNVADTGARWRCSTCGRAHVVFVNEALMSGRTPHVEDRCPNWGFGRRNTCRFPPWSARALWRHSSVSLTHALVHPLWQKKHGIFV